MASGRQDFQRTLVLLTVVVLAVAIVPAAVYGIANSNSALEAPQNGGDRVNRPKTPA